MPDVTDCGITLVPTVQAATQINDTSGTMHAVYGIVKVNRSSRSDDLEKNLLQHETFKVHTFKI